MSARMDRTVNYLQTDTPPYRGSVVLWAGPADGRVLTDVAVNCSRIDVPAALGDRLVRLIYVRRLDDGPNAKFCYAGEIPVDPRGAD